MTTNDPGHVEYETTSPALIRPYVPKPNREGRVIARVTAVQPVRIRLIGIPADVARTLEVLDQVFTLTAVSAPRLAQDPGEIRVYATITRRYPYQGGPR